MTASIWFCAARLEDVVDVAKEYVGRDPFTAGEMVGRGPSWSEERLVNVPHLSIDGLGPPSIAALFAVEGLACIDFTRVERGSSALRQLMKEDCEGIAEGYPPQQGPSLWSVPVQAIAALARSTTPFDQHVAAWEKRTDALGDVVTIYAPSHPRIQALLAARPDREGAAAAFVATMLELARTATEAGGGVFGLYEQS